MVRRMSTVHPGEVLGLAGALSGAHSVTTRAATSAQLGFVPAHRLLELLEHDAAVRGAALACLAEELARTRTFIVGHSARLVPAGS